MSKYNPKSLAEQGNHELSMLGKHSCDQLQIGAAGVEVIVLPAWAEVIAQNYKNKPVQWSGSDFVLDQLGVTKKKLVIASVFHIQEKNVVVCVGPDKADISNLMFQLSLAVKYVDNPKVRITKLKRNKFFVEPLGPASQAELSDPAIVEFLQRDRDGQLNLEAVIPTVSNEELLNDPQIVFDLKEKEILTAPAKATAEATQTAAEVPTTTEPAVEDEVETATAANEEE
jgi:hypothetical protein